MRDVILSAAAAYGLAACLGQSPRAAAKGLDAQPPGGELVAEARDAATDAAAYCSGSLGPLTPSEAAEVNPRTYVPCPGSCVLDGLRGYSCAVQVSDGATAAPDAATDAHTIVNAADL
jgi:hypothetical protein